MTRLTGRGYSMLAVAVVLAAAGQLAGYPLLLALAGVGLASVLGAVLVSTRRPRVSVSRDVYPSRVQRGGKAYSQLEVHNTGGRRQSGFVAGDRVGDGYHAVAVRPLRQQASATYFYDLPTDRRGRHQVGPLTLDRSDPLGLGRSRVTTGDSTTLWVHPRTYPVRAVAGGHPRHHHEGRVGDEALRGSLDLREVREYVVGDEVRLVHWKATARTGQLMVREYVDPNQPRFTALLDTRRAMVTAPMFEHAVDVAASLVVSAALADHRCRLVTSCGVDLATNGGAHAGRMMLDELCLLERSPDRDLPLMPGALSRSGGGNVVVVLSEVTTEDRAAIAALRPRFTSVLVIVLGGPDGVSVPGATVLSADSAAEAAKRWNAAVTG